MKRKINISLVFIICLQLQLNFMPQQMALAQTPVPNSTAAPESEPPPVSHLAMDNLTMENYNQQCPEKTADCAQTFVTTNVLEKGETNQPLDWPGVTMFVMDMLSTIVGTVQMVLMTQTLKADSVKAYNAPVGKETKVCIGVSPFLIQAKGVFMFLYDLGGYLGFTFKARAMVDQLRSDIASNRTAGQYYAWKNLYKITQHQRNYLIYHVAGLSFSIAADIALGILSVVEAYWNATNGPCLAMEKTVDAFAVNDNTTVIPGWQVALALGIAFAFGAASAVIGWMDNPDKANALMITKLDGTNTSSFGQSGASSAPAIGDGSNAAIGFQVTSKVLAGVTLLISMFLFYYIVKLGTFKMVLATKGPPGKTILGFAKWASTPIGTGILAAMMVAFKVPALAYYSMLLDRYGKRLNKIHDMFCLLMERNVGCDVDAVNATLDPAGTPTAAPSQTGVLSPEQINPLKSYFSSWDGAGRLIKILGDLFIEKVKANSPPSGESSSFAFPVCLKMEKGKYVGDIGCKSKSRLKVGIKEAFMARSQDPSFKSLLANNDFREVIGGVDRFFSGKNDYGEKDLGAISLMVKKALTLDKNFKNQMKKADIKAGRPHNGIIAFNADEFQKKAIQRFIEIEKEAKKEEEKTGKKPSSDNAFQISLDQFSSKDMAGIRNSLQNGEVQKEIKKMGIEKELAAANSTTSTTPDGREQSPESPLLQARIGTEEVGSYKDTGAKYQFKSIQEDSSKDIFQIISGRYLKSFERMGVSP